MNKKSAKNSIFSRDIATEIAPGCLSPVICPHLTGIKDMSTDRRSKTRVCWREVREYLKVAKGSYKVLRTRTKKMEAINAIKSMKKT